MNHSLKSFIILISISTISLSSFAGQAIIEKVEASCNYKRICKFNVTIRHADEGWSHFANGWQIFTPAGELLGHRALAHPHVNEQPFTRSISRVKIPASVDTVILKAHDSVHGESERKYVLKLKFTDY